MASSAWSRRQISSNIASNCLCGVQSVLTTSWTNENPGGGSLVVLTLEPEIVIFFPWCNQEVYERGKEVIHA